MHWSCYCIVYPCDIFVILGCAMKELQTTPTTNLAELIVIPSEMPVDYYKNTDKYQKELDTAIETAKSLVHPVDDEGRKLAKADAAMIRKLAKTHNDFALSTFRSLTDKVKLFKDAISGKAKDLEKEADNIISRFDEFEKVKLDNIQKLLEEKYWALIEENNIKLEYHGVADFRPMIKLTGSLTDSGALSKKAVDFLKAIVADKLATQNKIESRILIIENRCLKAEINPPLSKVHFGTVLYAEDEVFNAKLEELIDAEVYRREQMAERIRKQQEAENQRKIDDALRLQQDEANRIAKADQATRDAALREEHQKQLSELRSKVIQEPIKQPEIKKVEESFNKVFALEPVAPVVQGKRTVRVMVQFDWPDVGERSSDEAVTNFLETKLRESLPEKLINMMTVIKNG